eukprot:216403-Pleurochrysis_carterae.AAC.1
MLPANELGRRVDPPRDLDEFMVAWLGVRQQGNHQHRGRLLGACLLPSDVLALSFTPIQRRERPLLPKTCKVFSRKPWYTCAFANAMHRCGCVGRR